MFPLRRRQLGSTYPPTRLLPLKGTITDALVRKPDMRDSNLEPCLSVVKRGSAIGTTIGRANGAFSVVRNYFADMPIHQTSMEGGNSQLRQQVGGLFSTWRFGIDNRGHLWSYWWHAYRRDWWHASPDLTYATPFWWLLEHIKAKGFLNGYLNTVDWHLDIGNVTEVSQLLLFPLLSFIYWLTVSADECLDRWVAV